MAGAGARHAMQCDTPLGRHCDCKFCAEPVGTWLVYCTVPAKCTVEHWCRSFGVLLALPVAARFLFGVLQNMEHVQGTARLQTHLSACQMANDSQFMLGCILV